MVHPDYQYTPLLVPAMAGMVASGVYDMVLGSRILGAGHSRAECRSTSMSPTGFLPRFKTSFWASNSRSITPGSGILARVA